MQWNFWAREFLPQISLHPYFSSLKFCGLEIICVKHCQNVNSTSGSNNYPVIGNSKPVLVKKRKGES